MILGVIFLVGSFVFLKRFNKENYNSRTTGKIVEIREECTNIGGPGESHHITYVPVYEFYVNNE